MILHVDMDAFYASVEQRDNPALRGKPVIVGGSPTGRGVVSAASYEARRFGVHSAMPTSQAIRLCPSAVVVRTRMDFYAAVSRQIREIFGRYTPEIEPLSLDEAFLNVAGTQQLFGSAVQIGQRIQQEIRQEIELVASVGVAPNKFLAKLASDLEKPAGFTIIHPDRVLETLAPLPIARMWGVGNVTAKRLADANIHTFGDLQQLTQQHATTLLGNVGAHFWKLARGIDDRSVVPERSAKSISHETTFASDITNMERLQAWLLELTDQVASRLRQRSICGRTVHLKLRYADFHTITRARTLSNATDSTDALWRVASDMLCSELPDRRLNVRLIGIGVSGLEHNKPRQLWLFDDTGNAAASPTVDQATDLIRKQFGGAALRRASSLEHKTALRRTPRVDD